MLASLRKTLVDAHVAAVTVAALLSVSIGAFYDAADHVLRAVVLFIQLDASHRLYDYSYQLAQQDSYMLPVTLCFLASALVTLLCAWLVSRWAYGVGPLRSLAPFHEKLTRKFHA